MSGQDFDARQATAILHGSLDAAAREQGEYLCQADPLNPCWNNRPTDVAGKHWSGLGDACPNCQKRAAIAAERKADKKRARLAGALRAAQALSPEQRRLVAIALDDKARGDRDAAAQILDTVTHARTIAALNAQAEQADELAEVFQL